MILERTIAPVFAANCYVLAPAPGGPALVVDPGAGAARTAARTRGDEQAPAARRGYPAVTSRTPWAPFSA